MRTHSAPSRDGSLYLLRIEVDGHFHGGEPVKPWVARITGTDAKYGLARDFIRPMNDWRDAHKAWSGNVYGVVATFPLRDGNMYEVQRCRGNSSKRHVVREFVWIDGGRQHKRTPEQALAHAEGDDGPAAIVELHDSDPDDLPYVAHVKGLGTPERLGFVLVDGERRYRLRDGRLYEVHSVDGRDAHRGPFAVVQNGRVVSMPEKEALAWLRDR